MRCVDVFVVSGVCLVEMMKSGFAVPDMPSDLAERAVADQLQFRVARTQSYVQHFARAILRRLQMSSAPVKDEESV